MTVRLKRQTPAQSGYPDDARVGAGFHPKAYLGEGRAYSAPSLASIWSHEAVTKITV